MTTQLLIEVTYQDTAHGMHQTVFWRIPMQARYVDIVNAAHRCRPEATARVTHIKLHGEETLPSMHVLLPMAVYNDGPELVPVFDGTGRTVMSGE
jgi:hypothetical protein